MMRWQPAIDATVTEARAQMRCRHRVRAVLALPVAPRGDAAALAAAGTVYVLARHIFDYPG